MKTLKAFPIHKNQAQNSRGFTLVEVLLVIVVLGIAMPALMFLHSSLVQDSTDSVVLSKAVLYAEEKMEEIIADKRNPAKGYDWVVTPGNYPNDVPASGYTRSVIIQTSGKIQNGVPYAFVQVTVSHNEIPDLRLTTWLTDY